MTIEHAIGLFIGVLIVLILLKVLGLIWRNRLVTVTPSTVTAMVVRGPKPAAYPDIHMYPGDVPFLWKVTVKDDGVPVDISQSEISAPVFDDGVLIWPAGRRWRCSPWHPARTLAGGSPRAGSKPCYGVPAGSGTSRQLPPRSGPIDL